MQERHVRIEAGGDDRTEDDLAQQRGGVVDQDVDEVGVESFTTPETELGGKKKPDSAEVGSGRRSFDADQFGDRRGVVDRRAGRGDASGQRPDILGHLGRCRPPAQQDILIVEFSPDERAGEFEPGRLVVMEEQLPPAGVDV